MGLIGISIICLLVHKSHESWICRCCWCAWFQHIDNFNISGTLKCVGRSMCQCGRSSGALVLLSDDPLMARPGHRSDHRYGFTIGHFVGRRPWSRRSNHLHGYTDSRIGLSSTTNHANCGEAFVQWNNSVSGPTNYWTVIQHIMCVYENNYTDDWGII